MTINGNGMQLIGAEPPKMSKSGPYSEPKFGTNGDSHNLAKNDVYDILNLSLKYDSPNIEELENLARNHIEFPASYKDGNTGKTYNSTKATVVEIDEHNADEDRKFKINFLP